MNKKKTLKVGDKCPSFSLNNQKGEKIDISNIIGSKNILIYFLMDVLSKLVLLEMLMMNS